MKDQIGNSKKRPVKLLIGIVITVVAFWLSFRNINIKDLEASFLKIDSFWVVVAIFNTLLTVYVMGYRMKLLLQEDAKIPFFFFFKANIISQYLNIVVPGRFGELGKSYVTARKYPVSGSLVLGTVVIERIFDYLVFLVFWIVVPALFTFQDKVKGYSVAVILGIVSVLGVTVIVWKREEFKKLTGKLINFLPRRFRERMQGVITRGLDAFSKLSSSKVVIQLVLITITSYLFQALTNYLLFQAFGFSLTFFEALFVVLIIAVGNAPPSVPGKIGVFEYVVVLGLTLFGVEGEDALSYAILLHIVAFAPKIVLGFFFMMEQDLSLKKAGKEIEKLEMED